MKGTIVVFDGCCVWSVLLTLLWSEGQKVRRSEGQKVRRSEGSQNVP